MLPSDYSKILSDGVQALRGAEAELRTRAERESNAPELWLAVRDLNGLIGRLDANDDWDWQTGSAIVLLSGLDLGALSTLLEDGDLSPYSDQAGDPRVVSRNATVRSLYGFLERYMAREFELEDSTTYPRTDDASPS